MFGFCLEQLVFLLAALNVLLVFMMVVAMFQGNLISRRTFESAEKWTRASLMAVFLQERGEARKLARRASLGVNLLWMGFGDPREVFKVWQEFACDDHVRHVAGERFEGLYKTAWPFFSEALQQRYTGVATEEHGRLKKRGIELRNGIRDVIVNSLTFEEGQFEDWLENRPSGREADIAEAEKKFEDSLPTG